MWHTIGVDLIGPLPETPRGKKYIMTVSCLFSKWPEATALPDKKGTGVAEFLYLCYTRHGCCKVKISDNISMRCFNSIFFFFMVPNFTFSNRLMMNFTGIKCNVTSAYHPQSNGLDE